MELSERKITFKLFNIGNQKMLIFPDIFQIIKIKVALYSIIG